MTRARRSGGRRPSSEARDPVKAGDAENLERAALRYLERMDTTALGLKRALRRFVVRRLGRDGLDSEAELRIERLVERYCSSGLVDDARFARALTYGLKHRGTSLRMMREKLRRKGVGAGTIEGVLANEGALSPAHELESARRYVRRRRFGPHSSKPPDSKRARRELMALARAGFSSTVARVALGFDRNHLPAEEEVDGNDPPDTEASNG